MHSSSLPETGFVRLTSIIGDSVRQLRLQIICDPYCDQAQKPASAGLGRAAGAAGGATRNSRRQTLQQTTHADITHRRPTRTPPKMNYI